jgi:hypothetical protein
MFDVLILLAKIKKWFGQFGDLGGLFFGSGGLGGPSVFWVFLWVDTQEFLQAIALIRD